MRHKCHVQIKNIVTASNRLPQFELYSTAAKLSLLLCSSHSHQLNNFGSVYTDSNIATQHNKEMTRSLCVTLKERINESRWRRSRKVQSRDVRKLPSPCPPAVRCSLFWTVGSLVLAWFWSGSAADPKPGENSAAGLAPAHNITGTTTF